MTTRSPGPPWPLYPKLVCVAVLLGGFVCALVLILASPRADLADWRNLVAAVGTVFKLVIVPASFGTVVFSLLLFWRARRWFLKQRWAQVKVGLLVLTLPALHWLARWAFTGIRRDVEAGSPPTGRLEFFTELVGVSIAVLLIALWLARFRPRLPFGPGRSRATAHPEHGAV